VKVCSSWLKRLWGVETSGGYDLNKMTKIMDTCGAYDGTGDNMVANHKEDFA
jgi:hypothetical protein